MALIIGRKNMRLWLIRAAVFTIATAPAPLAAESGPRPSFRTLSVSGEGEVRAVPDEAQLSAGVVSQGPTAAQALDTNRSAMLAVFAALKRQGIPDRSIRTSEFSVSPQYGKDNGDTQRIMGYQVSNRVSVTIDDLSKLGTAIDALVSSGVNSMGGVNFTIRDRKPLLERAREAAVKDALDRAQTYAKAAGLTLGRVTAFSESEAPGPRPLFQPLSVTANIKPTPIAAGEETVSADVTMTFEIK